MKRLQEAIQKANEYFTHFEVDDVENLLGRTDSEEPFNVDPKIAQGVAKIIIDNWDMVEKGEVGRLVRLVILRTPEGKAWDKDGHVKDDPHALLRYFKNISDMSKERFKEIVDKLYPVRKGEALSVPQQHQKKIAIETLQMSDVGANIMGGMTKEQARTFLKGVCGYSDSQIKSLEK